MPNIPLVTSFRRALAGKFCQGTESNNVAFEEEVVGIAGPHSQRASRPGPCDYQDQKVTGLNKCSAHTPLQAFASEHIARTAPLEDGNVNTQFRRLLTPPDTRWKFHLSETPDKTPPIVAGKGFVDTESWSHMEVPISLECGGFGQPFYTNFVYPFKCDPPKIAPAINYVGCYQHEIRIPASWAGRRIFLYFEGAGAALHCWLDGRFVGYSQDSFLPAEFEITAHVLLKIAAVSSSCHARGAGDLRSGDVEAEEEAWCGCVLSIQCYRFSDGSYLESQDMWWLSGTHA